MRRSIFPPPLPPFVAPAPAGLATIVVLLLTTASTWRPAESHGVFRAPEISENARYLLPLFPPRITTQLVPLRYSSAFSGIGARALGKGDDGETAVGIAVAAGRGPANGGVPTPQIFRDVPIFSESELAASNVYIESQTDEPVERDPNSAGPAYPADLEKKLVEGAVTIAYIVDTTGRPDSSSMRVKASTHDGFVDAVRAALPGMHFRPALIGGRAVRQLVIQEFKFVLRQPADSSGRRPVARAPASPSSTRDTGA